MLFKHKKHIVAIIPARGGSKGIPQKNIINFCGKPLIAWTIEQVLGSSYVNDVYVSTDDDNIKKIATDVGAKTIIRPNELSTDTSSSEEAILHTLNIIETDKAVDLVVFLQATSPLRFPSDIDNAITILDNNGADSLFSASIFEDVCLWKNEGGCLRSLTYDYTNRGRRQDRKPYYLENGSIYIFKPEIIKNYKNRLGGKISAYFMPMWMSFEIDTEEDIPICTFYMNNKIIGKISPS